jgi:translation initiation factor 2 subunit 2
MLDAHQPESIDDVGKPQAEAKEEDQLAAELNELDEALLKKKKKKKKVKAAESAEAAEPKTVFDAEISEQQVTLDKERPWDGTEQEYTYTQMLERVFKIIKKKNPTAGDKKSIRLPPADLQKVGTKKTMWANFANACAALQRSQEHVMAFFMAELATEGSLDSKQRLVMKGKFVPSQIESLIKKYFMEYVACSMCRSCETTLTRDPTTRLYFISCSLCGSRRSVIPIKSGFHATSRADRRAARA